ncbi:MAG: prepilin-type N-terminal cleavage/methylation domain-containing protein [bacterium]
MNTFKGGITMITNSDPSLHHAHETRKSGFTMIEIMVVLMIFPIILYAGFKILISQKRVYQTEQELSGMCQNTRATLDILLRDLRMAGYKVIDDEFLGALDDWIYASDYLPDYPYTVNLSAGSCPLVTKGSGTKPDMVTLFIADAQECLLSVMADSNDTQIILDSNSPGFTETKFRVNDIIRIGDNTEFAKVTGLGSWGGATNNLLTIDTDPNHTGNQGLALPKDPNEVVRKINIITYALFNEANDASYAHHKKGHPVLKRKFNNEDYDNVCEDVEDFQINPNSYPIYSLHLRTRTATRGDYMGAASDGYKKTDLHFTFQMRNFKDFDCPLPAIPSSVAAVGFDSLRPCSMNVSWDAVTTDKDNNPLSPECAVTRYIIAYDMTADGRSYMAYPGLDTDYTFEVHESDPNNPVYHVSVAAVNMAGVGGYSAEELEMDTNAPADVTDVEAVGQINRVSLEWVADPECDVREFRVYRSLVDTGPYDLIYRDFDIKSGLCEYQDANVIQCCLYYYKIVPFDDAHESINPAVVTGYADSSIPAAPSNFDPNIPATLPANVYATWTLSPDDKGIKSLVCDPNCGYYIYAIDAPTSYFKGSYPPGSTSGNFEYFGYAPDIIIRFRDSCGKFSKIVYECTGAIPTVAINKAASESSKLKNMTIEGTFTVASGSNLELLQLKVDEGNKWYTIDTIFGANWSYLLKTAPLPDGKHIITVMATDDKGCSGDVSCDIYLQDGKEDKIPPLFEDIKRTPSYNPVMSDDTVNICVIVTDPSGISGVMMKISAKDSGTSSLVAEYEKTTADSISGNEYCFNTIGPHPDCTITCTLTATDSAGNSGQITHSYMQYEGIDPNIASITLTSDVVGGVTRTIQFDASIFDASGIKDAYFIYQPEGGAWSSPPVDLIYSGGNTYSGSCAFSKLLDWCSIKVTAVDNAFNMAEKTKTEIFIVAVP